MTDESVVCPSCHGPVTIDGAIRCATCGTVGRDEGWRLAWSPPPELADRIGVEESIWDAWAALAPTGPFPRQPSLDEWLSERALTGVRRHYPELADAAGKRVLDVGATLRFGVRFLHAGAERLDQVEISAATQEHALRRLEDEGIDRAGRVFFHAVPAETLPFPDAAFDIVFSSGTIAHTLRERSLPELVRVLRPGGVAFIVDAFLPKPLLAVMRLRRGLDRRQRGTRIPLTVDDIATLRSLLVHVRFAPFDVLWLFWGQLVGTRHRDRVERIDRALGTWGGIAHLLGTQCWIAGYRPR